MQLSPFDKKLLVPVELCGYCYRNKQVNTLKVYLHLKAVSSGKLHEDSYEFNNALKGIFKTQKTFDKHLKKLVKANWIGYNPKSKIYFIRGFDAVNKELLIKSKSGVVFNKNYFKNFREFAAATIICHWINWKKWKDGRTGRSMRGRPKQSSYPSSSSIQIGIANSIIAKLLGVSKTQACQLKHKIEKAGFIKTRKQYLETAYDNRHFIPDFTGTEAKKLKIVKGKLVKQHYDAITHILKFKRRKRRRR